MVTILKEKLSNSIISIRWKLVFTYLFLIIIFVMIIRIFVAQTMYNVYLDEVQTDIVAEAKILASQNQYYLSQSDYQPVREDFSNQLKEYSNKIQARILLLDPKLMVLEDSDDRLTNTVYASRDARDSLAGATVMRVEEESDRLIVAEPIVYFGETIGVAIVVKPLTQLHLRVDEVTSALDIISIFGILIVLVISMMFSDLMTKPISELTETFTKMSQGNLHQRVEIHTRDELEKLATAFNIMSTKLDQVDYQRREFVGNVSHELKTPLASIKLLSSSLLGQEENDEALYREFLTDIDHEVDRLNEIIVDLLLLVDLDREKLSLNYKPALLNYLIEQILYRLQPVIKETESQVIFTPVDRIQLNCDGKKIEQAVYNVIQNAIKYSAPDGKVDIVLRREGKFAVIEVTDNGIGIQPEGIDHIFERFYRTDKARSRKTGGTGLGLSITNQIIELHQGRVEVESELGQGSKFKIWIPEV
ncbi:ATP-binding protein [Gottschalkiaceae bacterium SANA]|nr:ATP-binding protein [Gottschalkiaceae bacterium SANA]